MADATLRTSKAMMALMLLIALAASVMGDVVLTLPKESLTFPSTAASFGPRLPKSGFTGQLTVASPVDACGPIVPRTPNGTDSIVLIRRGGHVSESNSVNMGDDDDDNTACSFVLKVRKQGKMVTEKNAKHAGCAKRC